MLRHQDKRTNIPTDELRGFVEQDEQQPPTALYPRDPSLDPQLVWRGKDEQDRGDLAVPSVPIYIQEKVHPRVLVENLRRTGQRSEDEPELTLFGDFNGIEFEELVDFYAHEQNWTNRLILGDSLLVMNSLVEKENLRGKVQTIFIDPPYGIGFGSNWQVSTQDRDVRDGKLDHLTRQPEQIRAFRDTWKDGIHSYLSYLRDRLAIARELLTGSGSVFVQIGDENVHLVRSLLDEAFGGDNFVSLITFRKTSGAGSPTGGTTTLPAVSDYLLWYARDKSQVKYRPLYRAKAAGGAGAGAYSYVEESDGLRRRATKAELLGGGVDGRLFRLDNLTSQTTREAQTTVFPVEVERETFRPARGGWKTNSTGMERLKAARRLMAAGRTLSYVRYLDDFPAFPLNNAWEDTVVAGFGEPKTYVVQTNTKVVERCVLMTSDPGDLVLDPTNGSGSTAVVAEEWGRRWIAIDTSRVAVALTRTRLAALKLPYYLLADSKEGQGKESAITGRPGSTGSFVNDVRKGFVYKRVPHVMLRDIAQNAEIEAGMSREQVEQAIERHSEQELLFDQPYEDRRIVRVCGPFTVESLSPHRMLSEAEVPEAENVPQSSGGFEDTILGNLRKAGVQNRDRAQRLDFEALEPYAGGRWIHARGAFTDEEGQTRTVGISLGPEYGTVGSDQVREAAKEAVKGVGFDLLLVCGFAFDAHSNEAAREFAPEANGGGWAIATEERSFGRLPVMLVRMNQDLSMGEELLKKTGAGNLFMVFGEPDVLIDQSDDGMVEVEVRGVDVYDPTTGEIRSDSTDDIACWSIDTDYNGESFFAATRTSLAPTTRTSACAKPSRLISTGTPGRASTALAAVPSRSRAPGGSPSRSSTITVTRC
ncbi:MAG: site-specific DNA-methyltransferase [Solirubrobacteraceae bacterium MAG38_C4-C5]|nr:site-specific DNA-methyltransferase [Candidatus Siliceabacter maunaloa]